MIRHFAAGLALMMVPAMAAASPMERLHVNTLIVTGPEGSTHLWYDADHSFTGVNPDGEAISGTWKHSGTTICSIVLTPREVPEQCGPLDYHNPGDAWSRVRPNGDAVTVTLITGRLVRCPAPKEVS